MSGRRKDGEVRTPVKHPYGNVSDIHVICPWCGHKHGDPWELVGPRDDDRNKLQCYGCDRYFDVWAETSISYCTNLTEDDEELVETDEFGNAFHIAARTTADEGER